MTVYPANASATRCEVYVQLYRSLEKHVLYYQLQVHSTELLRLDMRVDMFGLHVARLLVKSSGYAFMQKVHVN